VLRSGSSFRVRSTANLIGPAVFTRQRSKEQPRHLLKPAAAAATPNTTRTSAVGAGTAVLQDADREAEIATREEDFGLEFARRVKAEQLLRSRIGVFVPFTIVGLAALAGLIDPIASWLIVLVPAAALMMLVTPVRPLLLVTFLIALAVDNPRSFPANGNWSPPWIFLSGALYRNLEPLPVCLLDLLAVGCAIRGLFHVRTESKLRIGRERIFARIVAIPIATLAFTFVSGVLRGGDLKQAVYQGRTLFWIPCFAIAIATVGDMKFLRQLKNVLFIAVCIKASTGLWVYATVNVVDKKRPLDFVTTHADSVTYAMVVAVIIAAWVVGAEKRVRRWHGTTLVFALIGLYTNQRRIAFVGIAFALFIIYLDISPERRRVINKTASRFTVPFVVYMLVAFTGVSRAPIFRPALSLRSVVIQDDDSSSTRDIENFNLFVTYRTNPLIGTGFGHEYIELVPADYIGDVFEQYRYLPHNSLLGLWAYGGMVAAIGYYTMFPAALYLGLRATKRRYTKERWMFSMLGASGIATVLIQGFGDVGFHDQMVGLLGGIAVGVCGALYCAPDRERTRSISAPDERERPSGERRDRS
jgi:hypothetical protein